MKYIPMSQEENQDNMNQIVEINRAPHKNREGFTPILTQASQSNSDKDDNSKNSTITNIIVLSSGDDSSQDNEDNFSSDDGSQGNTGDNARICFDNGVKDNK